jgi:hypothetical protein
MIKCNKSTSSPGDYYHTFTLKISAKDKHRMIESIKSSSNFEISNNELIDLPGSSDRYIGPEQIQNIETQYSFVREYFKPNGAGYAPTFRRISILKKDNSLVFEDIDL